MIEGVTAVFGGMWYVLVTPRVWGYAAVPALMLVLLGCVLSGLGVFGADWTTRAMLGEADGFWGLLGIWSLRVLMWLAAMLAAILLAIVLAQPLSGFALEAVSLGQERA